MKLLLISLRLNFTFTMLCLKFSEHLHEINKYLLTNREVCDVFFNTSSSTVSAHSHILLQHVPLLSSLLCQHCRSGHEKTVIILPDVEAEVVEAALLQLYAKGDSKALNYIFSANNVGNFVLEETANEKSTKKTCDRSTPTNSFETDSGLMKSVQNSARENESLESKDVNHGNDSTDVDVDNETGHDIIVKVEGISENIHGINSMGSVANLAFGSPKGDITAHIGEDLINEYNIEEILSNPEDENTISLNVEEHNISELEMEETISNDVNGESGLDIQKTNDWLKHLEDNFEEVLIGGTDGTVRSDILANMERRAELTTAQSRALIRSLNHQLFLFLGSVKLDMPLARCLAALLVLKLPETFSEENRFRGVMVGSYRKEKGRGERKERLAIRIQDNYRQLYRKPGISTLVEKETQSIVSSEGERYFDEELLHHTDEDLDTVSLTEETPVEREYQNFSSNQNFLAFLKNIDNNFVVHMLNEVDSETKKELSIKLKTGEKFSKKLSQIVVHNLNKQVFDFLGPIVKPDLTIWTCLAEFLKSKFPSSFTEKHYLKAKGGLLGKMKRNYFSLQQNMFAKVGKDISEEKHVNKAEIKSINAIDVTESTESLDINQWLNHIESNFRTLILGGTDTSVRNEIEICIVNGEKLTNLQARAVIRSLTLQLHKFLGPSRPRSLDANLSRCLAALLGENIPETFADKTTFHGIMLGPPRKGSVQTDLSRRIADNYRSLYVSKLRRMEAEEAKELSGVEDDNTAAVDEVLKMTEELARCSDSNEWLAKLSANFMPIVIGGIDVTFRSEILSCIRSGRPLGKTQQQHVIRSLYHLPRNSKLGTRLSRYIACLLVDKIPETFRDRDALTTRIVDSSREAERRKRVRNESSKIADNHQIYSNLEFYEEDIAQNLENPSLQFQNISDWLKHLDANFILIIISNSEISNDDLTKEALIKRVKLSPSQKSSVLASLSAYTFQFTGAIKPDTSLCRCLAKLLEKYLPDTFAATESLVIKIASVFQSSYLE